MLNGYFPNIYFPVDYWPGLAGITVTTVGKVTITFDIKTPGVGFDIKTPGVEFEIN